jgi:hypothetical protein
MTRWLIGSGAFQQRFEGVFLASLLFQLTNGLDTPGNRADQPRGGGHPQQQWCALSHCPSDNAFNHA